MLKHEKYSGGFTLLELLVAMTIMSLVVMLMVGGLRLGMKVWERSETRNDDTEAIVASQLFLRRQFSSIYPIWQSEGTSRGHVQFDGDVTHVSFTGPAPLSFGPGGNLHYDLSIAGEGDLSIAWRNPKSLQPNATGKASLLNRVSAIELAYYGPNDNDEAAQWSPDWTGHKRLPQLIRLRVRFPPGDPRVWPELIVHPLVGVDTGCVYDPIAANCRGR